MSQLIEDFNNYRQKMNEKILAADNKVMKRIYSVDTLTYQDGALSTKTNEKQPGNNILSVSIKTTFH